MQDNLITEQSQKAALEHMLQEEKELMESVIGREMEKAASLQVDLATARQQKALSMQPVHCGGTSGHLCHSLQLFSMLSLPWRGSHGRHASYDQLCMLSAPSCISEPDL